MGIIVTVLFRDDANVYKEKKSEDYARFLHICQSYVYMNNEPSRSNFKETN